MKITEDMKNVNILEELKNYLKNTSEEQLKGTGKKLNSMENLDLL